MTDQTIRYQFTAETGQAQRAVRELSKSLQDQREAWKQSIYDERSKRAEIIAQIKKQELSILSLSKEEQKAAKEKLKLLKAEESVRSSAAKQSIASEQARLRKLERSEVGVTGLDRLSIPGGLLPGFGRLASVAGLNLPGGGIFSEVAQAYRSASGSSGGRVGGNVFAQARAAQATQAAAGAAQSLGGAAIGLTAALGTAGLLGAFALLGMGAAKLTEQLKEANEVSKGTITSTTAFAREFGMSRSEARKFAIENEIRVERLGASLPISSSDINAYAGIMNNSGIAATLGGDRSAYQRLIIGDERSAGTATRFALLRQSLGNRVNDAQATSAAGLLAGGGTRLKDLNIEFFKASGLYEQLKKENFDSLQGVARIEAVNRALANLVPDAAIAEMQGQIDAMVSSVNDRLFSPRTGLFGALRPLQNLGGKSLYEEVSRSLGEGASVMSKGGFGAIADAFRLDKRGGIGEVLGRSFNELLDGIIANPGVITAFTAQLGNEIGSFLGAINWGKLALSLGMIVADGFAALVVGAVAIGGGWIRTAGGILGEELRSGLSSIWTMIVEWIKGIPEQVWSGIQNFATVGNAQAKYNGTAIAAASGYLPLGSAIAAELRAKPANSGLIIANDSEYVFQPSQLSALLTRTAQSASTVVSIASGAITIVQQPGESSEALADRVIQRLDELVRNERNYRLA